ncbi:MAG TPA: sulfatase [Alphaproteobacteria bacterium]|nr:sulfatase [Alphaproteobacteria bacterium]
MSARSSACLLWAIALVAMTGTAYGRARDGACAQIMRACKAAGFEQGAAKSGNGLKVDCLDPIMNGTPQPRHASRPLPHVDAGLAAACRTQGLENQAPITERAPVIVPPSRPAPPGSPNIVFVLTDDLSMNLLQFMPHVQRMQKEGMTFANYFVTDSLCCPSRTSIFTGRFPHDSGVFKNTGEDGGYAGFINHGNEGLTFAVALASGGYKTAMLGKYLNGYEPPKHPVGAGWGYWAVGGSTGYAQFNYNLSEDGKVVRYGYDPADYLTDIVSEHGVKFIQREAGKPFFIEIATYAPHAPYIPAPRDADAFPGLRAPRGPAFDAMPERDTPPWLARMAPLSDDDKAKIDRAFRMRAQSVLSVDKMIGDLQAALARTGQDRNTYFVFSSDNGYHMGEYRLMPGKMTAFDTDIHVPLIITGPGVPAGRVVNEIVENIDLCSTFSELAGAAPPRTVDGHSLVPLLHGQPVTEWRSAALIEHHGPHEDPNDPDAPEPRSGNPPSYEAIRMPDAVYVEYDDGTKEYHDLATDPDELHNSYASLPPARKASLRQAVEAMRDCHDAARCWAASSPMRTASGVK